MRFPVAVLAACLLLPASAQETGWQQVGKGITGNLSGLALEADGNLLTVHDNKLPNEPRLSRLVDGTMTALAWPSGAEVPIDLEALTELPGRPGEFVALASEGKAFHLAVTGTDVRLVGTFRLPGAKPFLGNNYEGLRIVRLQGGTVAVWTHRGGAGRDGLIFAASFALDGGAYRFGPATIYKLHAPWPEADRRDASDVVVRPDGEVIVSAASDPGDDGPFSSTLYSLGKLRHDASGLWELPAKPERFVSPVELPASRQTRKIEALALRKTALGGESLAIGTDDENAGGWLSHRSLRTPFIKN